MYEIQKIRKKTGLSQSKFAEYFNMPVRTIQKWEIGQASPPSYLLKMMKRIILLEQTKEVHNSTKLPEYLHELFWDIEVDKLDLDKNSDLIISRLYNFSGVEGRAWINMYYDKETIKKAACTRRDFEPIVANYLLKEFKLNLKEMAYYKQDLNSINWGIK